MKKTTRTTMCNSLSVLFFIALACINFVSAQIPQSFTYQAVARDGSGNVYSNQNASVRFSIHEASAGGSISYQEIQAVTTNQFGLFTVALGTGTPTVGTFNAINWVIDYKYLQVEMDLGSGYVDMGTSQLLSVPYSMHSATTTSVSGTSGYVAKFNSASTIDNSGLYDAGGLFGIGNTSPTAHLQINDNGSGSYGLYVYKNGTAENAIFIKDSPNSYTSNVSMSYNNVMGQATLDAAATGNGVAASLSGGTNASALYATSSATSVPTARFVNTGSGTAGYFNSPSGYALIVESGMVGIGTTLPNASLDIQNGSGNVSINIANSLGGYCVNGVTTGSAGGSFESTGAQGTGVYGTCDNGPNAWGFGGSSADGVGGRFSTTTGTAGYFNGNIDGTGTFNYTSDRKLKKNIQPLSGTLDKIMLLKPSSYQYRTGEFGSMTLAKGNHFGVIAQDLQEVFPDLVSTQTFTQKDKSGTLTEQMDYLAVNYNELIPILIKGMQEQQALIRALQSEVETLKGRK